jgi:acetylornithine deacetylase
LTDLNVLGKDFAKELDSERFIGILRKLIGEAKHLQNNPRLGITPEEARAAHIIQKELEPYSEAAGGPLKIELLEYVAKRPNLKVTYQGTTDRTVAFVGSHFDVVPADAETWDYDPFTLTVQGDKLFGRGTTDCLGHVALITCFLIELARRRPSLKRSIIILFIAGEEGGEKDVGIDRVVAAGKLSEVKGGPVYWVDAADSEPCCGTCGMMSWSLKCTGRLIHSGFPHKGINSIELASEALSIIQERFYEDFPKNVAEEGYQFSCGSNLKPTQIDCCKGGLNQICPECTVHGDIRLSPFYDVEDVYNCVEQYVKDINESMYDLPARGPYSKFVLGEQVAVNDSELRRGKVELKWNGGMDTFKLYAGIACNLQSNGHKAMVQACRETHGTVKPYSINGSLPLVNMMHKQGFDIQLCGFGFMAVYHGINEYCSLEKMSSAYQVFLRVVCLMENVNT